MGTTNGVCRKNSKGKRVHQMTVRYDGNKKQFVSCDKCGASLMK